MTVRQKPEMKLPTDPCLRLQMFEQAAYELSAGKKRAQVRHGDYWVEYSPGSITYLEREIARLRAICGKRTAITIGRTELCPSNRRT